MAFHLTTKKGYSLFEVSSALQKDIRRSNERNALYWAYELESSGFGGYLWKRLVIISMEDVGPANHDASARVLAFQAAYDELRRKKSKETNLAVASAVIYLARCNKSRLYDWGKCCMVDTHDAANLPIPSYALDMHTSQGRRNGKGIRDFFEEGCQVHPHKPAEGEAEYMEEMRTLYCMAATKAVNPDHSGGEDEHCAEQTEFFKS